MDEPLSNLDAKLRVMRAEIAKIHPPYRSNNYLRNARPNRSYDLADRGCYQCQRPRILLELERLTSGADWYTGEVHKHPANKFVAVFHWQPSYEL